MVIMISNLVFNAPVQVTQRMDRVLVIYFHDPSFSKGRRDELFKANPKYRKFFNLIRKTDLKLSPEEKKVVDLERTFMFRLIKRFLTLLDSIPETGNHVLK